MTSSYGVIELNSDDQKDILINALINFDGIASVKQENDLIYAKLNKNISASEINQYMIKKNITLSHLVKRKPTLEQQFLTLTNNK